MENETGTQDYQDQIHRAIAFEKAAEGLGHMPWLSAALQDALAQLRSSAIEQGISPEDWDTQKENALRLSEQQTDVGVTSSDTEQVEAAIDAGAISALSAIYGARVGWEGRIGEMPDLDARHPGKLMAFLDVQRKIDDGDESLSDRAERLYQTMEEQGVEPDEDFARVVQDQYEQFHAMAEADIETESDLLTAIDSAVGHPHAEVIESQDDGLVSRTADAALNWLYLIGANRYESESNTFEWNPETKQLTVEGDVSLRVQRHDEQWNDLGSEVDEAFVQRLEAHLNEQIKNKPSKLGQSR